VYNKFKYVERKYQHSLTWLSIVFVLSGLYLIYCGLAHFVLHTYYDVGAMKFAILCFIASPVFYVFLRIIYIIIRARLRSGD